MGSLRVSSSVEERGGQQCFHGNLLHAVAVRISFRSRMCAQSRGRRALLLTPSSTTGIISVLSSSLPLIDQHGSLHNPLHIPWNLCKRSLFLYPIDTHTNWLVLHLIVIYHIANIYTLGMQALLTTINHYHDTHGTPYHTVWFLFVKRRCVGRKLFHRQNTHNTYISRACYYFTTVTTAQKRNHGTVT